MFRKIVAIPYEKIDPNITLDDTTLAQRYPAATLLPEAFQRLPDKLQTLEDLRKLIGTYGAALQQHVDEIGQNYWVFCGLASDGLKTLGQIYFPEIPIDRVSGDIFRVSYQSNQERERLSQHLLAMERLFDEKARPAKLTLLYFFDTLQNLLDPTHYAAEEQDRLWTDIRQALFENKTVQTLYGIQPKDLAPLLDDLLLNLRQIFDSPQQFFKIRSECWHHAFNHATFQGEAYFIDGTQKQFRLDLPVIAFYKRNQGIDESGLFRHLYPESLEKSKTTQPDERHLQELLELLWPYETIPSPR